jgi:hypothetical protein
MNLYDADDNMLGKNISTPNKNTETLLDTCKEVGLNVNAEKNFICSCLTTRIQDKIII